MAQIGYFEGTDSEFLTRLVARGHETLPLGNGVDNYGKDARKLTMKDGIDVVVGYLHKVMTVEGVDITTEQVLSACTKLEIPVLLMIPAEEIRGLKTRLGALSPTARFIEPSHVLVEIEELLDLKY
ncbi:MAG: hypothetical protein GY771_05455 [bacterium]|nr:hypothetical protein [bacterium]